MSDMDAKMDANHKEMLHLTAPLSQLVERDLRQRAEEVYGLAWVRPHLATSVEGLLHLVVPAELRPKHQSGQVKALVDSICDELGGGPPAPTPLPAGSLCCFPARTLRAGRAG